MTIGVVDLNVMMYAFQERQQKGSCFSEAWSFWQILFSQDGYNNISHAQALQQCYVVPPPSKTGAYLSTPLNLVDLVIALINRQGQKSVLTYPSDTASTMSRAMTLLGAHENVFISLKIRI